MERLTYIQIERWFISWNKIDAKFVGKFNTSNFFSFVFDSAFYLGCILQSWIFMCNDVELHKDCDVGVMMPDNSVVLFFVNIFSNKI